MLVWLSKMVFAQHFCTVCRGWYKAQQSVTPATEECNRYDLTAAPCFSLANHNDWSMWFAIRGLPPICSPSFSLRGGVGKK
jgi:hypothetical protein